MIGEYDLIGRNYPARANKTEKYMMFETILLSKRFLPILLNDWRPLKLETELAADAYECPSPESTFGSIIKTRSENFNIFAYDIDKNHSGGNCLGYYHIAGERGWK